MKRYLLIFLVFYSTFIHLTTFAQDQFFHEILIEKKLIEINDWDFKGEVNFRHLYNEPAWRRWGVSLAGIRKIKPFRIHLGLNSYYTFNRNITNFFEVRPWTALQYHIQVSSGMTLKQRLKYEWRFFHTEDERSIRENYGRLRYQIGIDIPLLNDGNSPWTVRPIFEWFFIRDPATFERFPNERDYGLVIRKRLKNEHHFVFSYRFEEFYTINFKKGNGHNFRVGYSF
jgi:hypothetical protein